MDGFLWGVFVLTIIVVLTIVIGLVISQTYKARMSAVGKSSFEELANRLVGESEIIKTELAVMKESLASINKMLKEIE